MGKNIKNYTSAVSVERTVSLIEAELVKIGATSIEKSYVEGVLAGLIFKVETPPQTLNFRIPVDTKAAYDMVKEIPIYRKKKRAWQEAQAHRTAWRIILNWVEVQVAMIQLHQAEALQVFLPYAYDKSSNSTLYDKIKGSDFKMITGEQHGN